AAGTISTPGIDPLVVTVGAADESGTSDTRDDVVPTWSSQGPTPDGLAKPDVLAPGRKIVSVRVPGSTIDRALPQQIEGPQTLRLSGTSDGTAVTAGAAALLLARQQHLDPDQVKAWLVQTATHLTNVQGGGEINVAKALRTPVPNHAEQTARPATGLLRMLF